MLLYKHVYAINTTYNIKENTNIINFLDNEKELIDISSFWNYYDTVFLEPHEIDLCKYKPKLVDITNLWKENIFSFNNFQACFGYGTYNIKIIAPHKELGLRFDKIYGASKIYINNKLIFENGKVGKNINSSIPYPATRYYYFFNDVDTLDITIQVSNFHNKTKTPLSIVSLGAETEVHKLEYYHIISSSLNVSFLFASSLVFFFIFIFRRKEKTQLFFALLLLFVATRIALRNDILVVDLFGLSYITQERIEIFLQSMLAISMFGYFFTLHPNKILKIPNIILCIILILTGIISQFFSLSYLLKIEYYIRYFYFIIAMYGISILVIRLIYKRQVSYLFLFAFIIILLFAIVDIVYKGARPEMLVIFSVITTIIFVTSQIALLALRNTVLIKKLENVTTELSAANESLENRVQERTLQLEKQNIDLQKSKVALEHIVKTKNKLFSIIGHDLRSPLSVIQLYSEMLWEQCDNKDRRSQLQYILNSSAYALHLLNNLLIWGKKELDVVNINPSFFKPCDLIKESVDAFYGMAEIKQIKIETNCDDSVVFADKFITLLIINNLVNNAIKFSNHHSKINVTCKLINPAPNGLVKISIIDNGIGIEKTKIEKIMLGEVNISTKGTDNESGSGLGLKIVKEFVELNHGQLEIESEINKGSIFSIILQTKIWNQNG